MYADDTSLSFSSKSIHLINECVNEDLGYLKSWLNANKLSLNVTKTQSLVIGGSKRLNDLGPVYMRKNTSPARPGAERRGRFQSLFI